MNLSKGYYFGDEDPQTAYGILVRKEDVDSIKSFDDLADKVVVAQNGSLQEQFVQEQIPAYKKIQPCFLHKRWFPDGRDRKG